MYSQDGRILLFEDNRGVYIPLNFAEEMDHSKFTGYSWQDVEDLKRIGYREWEVMQPDDSQIYWDTWDKILNNAEHVDDQGYTWHLEQDMDVFLVCSALEKENRKQLIEQKKKELAEHIEDYFSENLQGVYQVEHKEEDMGYLVIRYEANDILFYITVELEREEDE